MWGSRRPWHAVDSEAAHQHDRRALPAETWSDPDTFEEGHWSDLAAVRKLADGNLGEAGMFTTCGFGDKALAVGIIECSEDIDVTPAKL